MSANESKEKDEDFLEITCPCGKTKVRATVPTVGAGYCHCNACRVLIQGIAFEGAVFPGGSLECVEGTLISRRRPDLQMTVHSCNECNIMVYHTEIHGLEIVSNSEIKRCYGGTIPAPYQPTFHIWYSNRVVNIADDLPKFADSSAAFGGSDKMMTSDGTLIEEEETTPAEE